MFGEGKFADCIALQPPEKLVNNAPWTTILPFEGVDLEFHMSPEIFISDGNEGSIVGDWVLKNGNHGGIHHLAYQVDNVEETMKEWKDKGWAEFS